MPEAHRSRNIDPGVSRRFDRWFDLSIGAGLILLALGGVELAVRLGKINPALVPPPTAIAQRTFEIIASGSFLAPLGATLYLLFTAYFVASAGD